MSSRRDKKTARRAGRARRGSTDAEDLGLGLLALEFGAAGQPAAEHPGQDQTSQRPEEEHQPHGLGAMPEAKRARLQGRPDPLWAPTHQHVPRQPADDELGDEPRHHRQSEIGPLLTLRGDGGGVFLELRAPQHLADGADHHRDDRHGEVGPRHVLTEQPPGQHQHRDGQGRDDRAHHEHLEHVEAVRDGDEQDEPDDDAEWVDGLQQAHLDVLADHPGPVHRHQQREVEEDRAHPEDGDHQDDEPPERGLQDQHQEATREREHGREEDRGKREDSHRAVRPHPRDEAVGAVLAREPGAVPPGVGHSLRRHLRLPLTSDEQEAHPQRERRGRGAKGVDPGIAELEA